MASDWSCVPLVAQIWEEIKCVQACWCVHACWHFIAGDHFGPQTHTHLQRQTSLPVLSIAERGGLVWDSGEEDCFKAMLKQCKIVKECNVKRQRGHPGCHAP